MKWGSRCHSSSIKNKQTKKKDGNTKEISEQQEEVIEQETKSSGKQAVEWWGDGSWPNIEQDPYKLTISYFKSLIHIIYIYKKLVKWR